MIEGIQDGNLCILLSEFFIKQYIDKARNKKLYFRVTEIEGELLNFENEFGYLMGRFMEILIVHFSDHYNKIEIK